MSYEPIVRNVYIVPVNGAVTPAYAPAIKALLDKVYAPAMVSWNVTVKANLQVDNVSTDGFATTGLSEASRYTPDMNAVIKAWRKANNLPNKTVVLFFVNAPNSDKLGYMPLTGNYGFIFNLGSNLELLAHELAHGTFNLKHTFSEKAFWQLNGPAPRFAEGTTQNLMDYTNGTELWKYQWDLIHNPETIVLGALDEEEGAKFLIGTNEKVLSIIEQIRCAYRTNKTFNYRKPLGFVNNVLRINNVTLSDSHTYKEISLVMSGDITACNPKKVTTDKKPNFYNFQFSGFSVIVDDINDAQKMEKFLFGTSDADYTTQQTMAVVKLHNELSKPSPDEDIVINLLYTLPHCTMQHLTSTTREKSLELMLNEPYLPEWNERIVVSLVASVLEDRGKSRSLYTYLNSNPELFYKLYNRTTRLRGELVEALTILCAQNWTQEQLNGLKPDRYYITGSKDLTLRSRFNDKKSIDIWQLWATDNLRKANSCYGIAPLAPVCLGDECTSCSSDDVAYLPAIYVQSLTDAADVKSIKTLANAALTFAGATGSVNLLLNSSKLARLLGAIELANLAADGVLSNPLVRARLAQTENGKAFLQVWPYVNIGIDLTAVSTDILVNFVNSGRKAAAVLDELPANKVGDRLDEAEEVLRGRGIASAGARFIAKSGSELKAYLDDLVTIPSGKTYSGRLYRYKPTDAPYKITDINPNMNPLDNRFKIGLYASTSKDGNLIEAVGYGGTVGKTQYVITNVQLNNLLDLTDEVTIRILGTSFEQMKLSGVANKYEYSHVVADWAKSKGYSGVKYYGAHGSGEVYMNINVFEQSTVNNSILNSAIDPEPWKIK